MKIEVGYGGKPGANRSNPDIVKELISERIPDFGSTNQLPAEDIYARAAAPGRKIRNKFGAAARIAAKAAEKIIEKKGKSACQNSTTVK